MMEIETISDVSGFHKGLKQLIESELGSETSFLYRGQTDASWEVSCSAIRRLEEDCTLDKSHLVGHLVGYLRLLIDRARTRGFLPDGFDKQSSDLELMAQLQHQGAATGLIDFTRQPLVALWFACKKSRNKAKEIDKANGEKKEPPNGAVYVLSRSKINKISNLEGLHKEIEFFYTKANKGDKLFWSWDVSALGDLDRIVAQSSVLVFGTPTIEKMQKLTIQADSKDAIIEELRTLYGINEETLFSDFSGYAIANSKDSSFDANSREVIDENKRTFMKDWLMKEGKGQSDEAKVRGPL